jgi:hypothetical protein
MQLEGGYTLCGQHCPQEELHTPKVEPHGGGVAGGI